jgi:GH15 family glucan-1,4-alpha-glucosidase
MTHKDHNRGLEDTIQLEHLGLIGNCQCAALVDRSGAIVWCCLPRFDSEPVFGALLDPDGGRFLIGAADGSPGGSAWR